MKTIVLAAGYATRMFPLTADFPKPLLPVGDTTILDRLLTDIDQINSVDGHIIVSNHKFFNQFNEWKNRVNYRNPIALVDDGSVTNETRLGAVKDLYLAIETCNLWNEDLLVVAADNIIDFSFSGFADFFVVKGSSLIMYYEEPSVSALQRTGVITLDGNNKVVDMEEKPEKPKSHYAVPPFYLYRKEDLHFIKELIKENPSHGGVSVNMDAPGNLVRFILSKTIIHAWPMPGTRFDVGSLESYYQIRDNCPSLENG